MKGLSVRIRSESRGIKRSKLKVEDIIFEGSGRDPGAGGYPGSEGYFGFLATAESSPGTSIVGLFWVPGLSDGASFAVSGEKYDALSQTISLINRSKSSAPFFTEGSVSATN